MYAPRPNDDPNERIDPDHYERSPSTGYDELTRVLDATPGADHTPECDAAGCSRDAEPVTIVDAASGDARQAVRCTDHAKPFLEVTS